MADLSAGRSTSTMKPVATFETCEGIITAPKQLQGCSYHAHGRKAKVRFLFSRESNSECGAGNACGASTGYGIEGTDTAYGAPGATTMTVTYDEKNLPAKVLFHDANHCPLNCVIFRRDSVGRLLSEETHQG